MIISPVVIREAAVADISALKNLFWDTVLTVNRRDYSEEQTVDWASCGDKESHWVALIARYQFFVAEDEREDMLGFTAISNDGELHSMFVHKDFQGQHIASRLLECAEAYAVRQGAGRIVSEVSLTARPFFERRGYRIVRRQMRPAKCLALVNFVMEKNL